MDSADTWDQDMSAMYVCRICLQGMSAGYVGSVTYLHAYVQMYDHIVFHERLELACYYEDLYMNYGAMIGRNIE